MAAPIPSQETRATLLGVVTDPSGAAIPGAKVTAMAAATGVITSAVSNDTGNFLVPFLIPGDYSLKVEKAGFKTFEQSPITLRLNDRTRVDVALTVGELAERVAVTTEAPLLEMASSDRGQVIGRLADLPVKSNNPATLINFAAGVSYTGSMIYFRPFDNGAINSFSINGGRSSRNEFQLDGTPNNFNYDVAYIPSTEAVQEFKIQTNTYDAQFGRTGGGIINMSIKSGANQFHGAAYEYFRRTSLNANTIQGNAAGQPRTEQPVDQYGFQLGGPVRLPKVYNGKDRTFFMFSFEHYRDRNPQPVLSTVPTPEQRQGDFSQTLNSSGKLYTIYDPLTVRLNPAYDPTKAINLNNLQYIRTAFASNAVPRNRMDPVAQAVAKYWPTPNQTGDPTTHVNNFFGKNAAEENTFNNVISRIDHTVNNAWKMYGRWFFSKRIVTRSMGRYDWGGLPTDAPTWAIRRNDGATLDFVGTLNPRTVVNVRGAFSRYSNPSAPPDFDQAQLGFPKALLSQLRASNKFPQFTWENYTSTNSDLNPQKSAYYTYSAQGDVLRIQGSHSMKAGAELRAQQYGQVPVGSGATGNYAFTRSWTTLTPQTNDPNSGNAIASFLLGDLNGGSASLDASPFNSQRYGALFFQDAWQAGRRLTLNLGLRWDIDMPAVERYNRQTRGFDFTTKSPIQVPGYDLKGGLLFTGVGGLPRTAADADWNNIQPRAGLAYKVLRNKPLVFRSGVGRYFLPVTWQMNGATGFSQSTGIQTSTPDYFPLTTLANPFPNGLIQPPGSSRGLATQTGDGLSFGDTRTVVPSVWQYSAGFQYELLRGLLLEAGYVGSKSSSLQVGRSQSYLTTDQLAKGTAYLSQVVPNPFYGVLPVATSRGAQSTIQLRNLLVQYPQYSGLTMNNMSLGDSWYNSAQFKVERRFQNGLWLLFNYTISKTMEAVEYKNAQDPKASRELVSFDIPQRFTLSSIYEFPVGPHKKWLNKGIASHLIGGWQTNWTAILQSGTPMGLPGGYELRGNPKLSSGQTLSHWFDTSKDLWVVQAPDTLRSIGMRSPNIRNPYAPQFDITLIREFAIRENHKLQFKASAFNAFNTPIFGGPNTSPSSTQFGVVTISQSNLPRQVELAFRYSF